MAARALERLEDLLTGIYDLDIGCRVGDFLVTDRALLPGDVPRRAGRRAALRRGRRRRALRLAVSSMPALLERLERHDPSDGARRGATSPTAGPRSRASAISSASRTTPATTGRCRASRSRCRRRSTSTSPASRSCAAASRAASRPSCTRSCSAARGSDPVLAAGRRVALPPREPPGGALLRPARAGTARPVPPRGRRLARATCGVSTG